MDVPRLLLELGGVVLGLGVVGSIAQRLGLPAVPLYLLGGLMFGRGGILPLATSEGFVRVGAEVGVVLLLLTLGLEYSAHEILADVRRRSGSGALDLVLNAAPGAITGAVLGWGLTACVVLAGVTYVSSSGITAKVLADLGRLGAPETPALLSILVVEDLVMAAYLPIVSALLGGLGVVRGGVTVAIALAAVAVVLFIAVRAGALLSRLVFTADDELLLLRVLGLALLVAGAAEELQVSAAVGAFLVGLMLSGDVAVGARAVLTPLRHLFSAVFFVFFGLQTDPKSIPSVAVIAIVLAVVTAASKGVVGWVVAARSGADVPARRRAAGALVARGEFSIAIAGLAVAAGERPRLGALCGAYVLFTAVLGPVAARVSEPLLRRLARSPAPGE